jgi:putative flippase GtrA
LRDVFASVYARLSASGPAQKLARSPYAAKVTKYAIGSVVALVTSVIVFAVMDWAGINTTIDSIVAFIAGAAPNWVLNRKWAWKMEARVEWMREIVAYIAISVVVLIATSAATGWTHDWARDHIAAGSGLRVIVTTAAYVLVQAVMFVAKFLVYDKWVFGGKSRLRAALRSRRQVWTAARANRTP